MTCVTLDPARLRLARMRDDHSGAGVTVPAAAVRHARWRAPRHGTDGADHRRSRHSEARTRQADTSRARAGEAHAAWCSRMARRTRRSRHQRPPAGAPARRAPPTPAPVPAEPSKPAEADAAQRLQHRPAAAALRCAALRRGQPARRSGHALSDRVGLQAPRPAGGDPARIRGLAPGAGSRRHQGLGASGDADRPAQLHRHRRRRDAAAQPRDDAHRRWRC